MEPTFQTFRHTAEASSDHPFETLFKFWMSLFSKNGPIAYASQRLGIKVLCMLLGERSIGFPALELKLFFSSQEQAGRENSQ